MSTATRTHTPELRADLDYAYACELRQTKRREWVEFHGHNAGEARLTPANCRHYAWLRTALANAYGQRDARPGDAAFLTVYGHDPATLDRGTPTTDGERIFGPIYVSLSPRDNALVLAG